MIKLSKEEAKAIETGMGVHYFRGNHKQFLKNHRSVKSDPWCPALSALNSVSYQDLKNALENGYSIERKCAICDGTDRVNGQVRIQDEMKPLCFGCLTGVAHNTPEI